MASGTQPHVLGEGRDVSPVEFTGFVNATKSRSTEPSDVAHHICHH